MRKNTALHSLVLLSALLLVLIWVNIPDLADFSLQLTAALVILLVLSRKISNTAHFLLTESTVSVICIVLLTSATGGLSSPFFFLNHFLLFELSLLLEPEVSVTLTLGLMTFYLYSHQVGPSIYNLSILLSFLFMTPLAFLVGKIYRKMINQKKEIANLSRKVENLENELIEENFPIPASSNNQLTTN